MTVVHPARHAVERTARERRAEAAERIRRAARHELSAGHLAVLGTDLLRRGRLTLNFHPDRPTALGGTVADGLLRSGRYVSQFVSGVSNGSRSAVAGGERDGWEHRLFAGAYRHVDEPLDRPVYGALDLVLDPHGGSPRFGSSFLVLYEDVVERVTMCVGDSHTGPRDVGTVAEPWSIVAGLVEQAAGAALLDRPLGLAALVDIAAGRFAPRPPDRRLDGYVEVQVHGGVDLRADVDAVVLDPSFRGTDVHRALAAAADEFDVELRWHAGSVLHVDDVPSDFRGPTMPALARRLAHEDRTIDAAAIGRGAAGLAVDPPSLAGDPPESALQQLKYLWHTLFALGHDAP